MSWQMFYYYWHVSGLDKWIEKNRCHCFPTISVWNEFYWCYKPFLLLYLCFSWPKQWFPKTLELILYFHFIQTHSKTHPVHVINIWSTIWLLESVYNCTMNKVRSTGTCHFYRGKCLCFNLNTSRYNDYFTPTIWLS